MIAEGFIEGRPVPWKAPFLGRNGGRVPTKDYATYEAWKARITLMSQALRAVPGPYAGEVTLDLEFRIRPARTHQQLPDRSNLVKACEDALQEPLHSPLILNDRQVWGGDSRRVVGPWEREGVMIRLVAEPNPRTEDWS